MQRLIYPLTLVAACSSSPPADVSGDYTVNVTDRANGCGIANWTEGNTSTAIPVTVTQQTTDKAKAQVIIQGGTGSYVDLVVGGRTFDGTVSGAAIDGALHGTRAYTMGGCTYTYTIDLAASLSKDTLTGTLTYIPATNNAPDCGNLQTCTSVQEFNGLRPPK